MLPSDRREAVTLSPDVIDWIRAKTEEVWDNCEVPAIASAGKMECSVHLLPKRAVGWREVEGGVKASAYFPETRQTVTFYVSLPTNTRYPSMAIQVSYGDHE